MYQFVPFVRLFVLISSSVAFGNLYLLIFVIFLNIARRQKGKWQKKRFEWKTSWKEIHFLTKKSQISKWEEGKKDLKVLN